VLFTWLPIAKKPNKVRWKA